MIKTSYIWVMIATMLAVSQGITLRDNTGYKPYNKAVFDAHNKARANPSAYATLAEAQKTKFVYDSSGNPTNGIWMDADFVAKSTQCSFTLTTSEGVKAFDEAINYLNNFKQTLNPLTWSESLSQSCFDHISAQGPAGTTGHYGSAGDSPSDRISRYSKWTGLGENLSYSDVVYPEDPILQLLIDDGVPSRGHRANIMKDSYTHLGVSWGCHSVYGEMCCFNYGTNITPLDSTLVAAYAPQVKTCSAYLKNAPDTTSGNYVLTTLTPAYAPTAPAASPSSTGTTGSAGTTGESTGSSGSTSAQTSYTISTSTDSDGVVTKVYEITQTIGLETTNYTFTWMGYSDSDAPSINEVFGYFGISN